MRSMRKAWDSRASRRWARSHSWLSKVAVGACTLAATAGLAASASAATGGNFIATGHDMDYHCFYGTPEECSYLQIAVNKVRNGSSLPILALDQGGTPTCYFYYGYGEYCYGGAELAGALSDAGFSSSDVVTVNPTSSGFSTMPFVDSNGKPLYSAIITASDESCGGCDNNSAGESAINARASDFATYFNAGGGILALSGAGNPDQYYGFVPLHVSGGPTYPPYTVTSDGAAIGVTSDMANCCATHNSFSTVPSGMVALETDSSGTAETIAAFNATITTGGGGGDGGGGFSSGPPAEEPITVAAQPVSATEGQSFSGSVATVSGDSDSAASDYTVSIDWGDGSTSSGTVDASGNVSGSHTYADEGSHTVKTTVTDADETSNTASDSSTATVADAALTAGQASASGGTEGTGGGSASFSFTDGNPNATASDFTATVNWGDGSSSAGTVSKNADGSFSVSAPGHTYAEQGKDTVTVSVSDDGGQTTSGSHGVTVADAALSAQGKPSSVSQPHYSGTLVSFTDANPNGSTADFTATIDWGDGSSSAGDVSANGSGGFDVNGSHTYASTGPYTVKVHVADDGGSTADASTQVLVYEYATGSGGSFAIGDKEAAVGTQVTFWSAQWAGANPMSSGSAPASFKGFGAMPSSTAPACGGSYTTGPGGSSNPPATVPAYMAVYVSSSVGKQGSAITGNIAHIVIVKTDAGYQNQPGYAGTGKVVATVC